MAFPGFAKWDMLLGQHHCWPWGSISIRYELYVYSSVEVYVYNQGKSYRFGVIVGFSLKKNSGCVQRILPQQNLSCDKITC